MGGDQNVTWGVMAVFKVCVKVVDKWINDIPFLYPMLRSSRPGTTWDHESFVYQHYSVAFNSLNNKIIELGGRWVGPKAVEYFSW